MDDGLRVVAEMNESLWGRLKNALEDLSEEEIHWQPLPQANTINVIIRHLRIEAQWHLDSLERGEPMPTIAVAAPQDGNLARLPPRPPEAAWASKQRARSRAQSLRAPPRAPTPPATPGSALVPG